MDAPARPADDSRGGADAADERQRAWVAGLRRGEREALEAVYAHHRVAVFSFLARASAERALAEDLTQETFVRLARSGEKLRTDTRLRAWLLSVARNLLVDRRRRGRLVVERLRELSLWPGRRPTPRTPFDLTEASESERALESALVSLPERLREVVLLCGVEGLAPKQVATMVGISEAAVRKRLSRGRAMLKKRLSEGDRHE